MSIESELNCSGMFKTGGIYHQNDYGIVYDTGIQTDDFEYADRYECELDEAFFKFDPVLSEFDEMVALLKDIDFEENHSVNVLKDSENEGLIPYEFEMDTIDVLNPDAQIKSYAANFWELASIIGDQILFKRPKYING